MRPARLSSSVVVATLASLLLFAIGTAARPPQQDQAPPVFRTGVTLVRLDVRVTDADGTPVRDLRADEVEIFEGGDRRPVLLFQHVVQPIGDYGDVAQRTIASEVSTNQGAPRGNVYVLVFDQTHITVGNEQRARMAAERFLKRRVKPGDRVALYALPGPGPQIEFTADAARAARELVSVRGSREDQQTGATGPMRVYEAYEIARGNQEVLGRYVLRLQENPTASDATVAASARRPAGRETDETSELRRLVLEDARQIVSRADGDARRFLQYLATVVGTLREVDGRKSVILFSEGFAIDNVRHELEDVAAAAAQAYCVIYAADLNPRGVDLSQIQPREVAAGIEILSSLEALGSLVSETDGVLFNDAGASADRVLNRIAEASQDYYLVGFEPSAQAAQDRSAYRRVRVGVRRSGARVSTRTGYSLGPTPSSADRRRTVERALAAPFSQQGLRVEYTTYVLAGSAAGIQRVFLSLAADLPLARPGAPPADVVFAVRNVRDGRLAASGSDTIALPESTRQGLATGVGLYRAQFELPPGVYLMRAVVREPGGLLGSADRRFQVRALGGPGVTAGDLILGSAGTRGLPVRATAHVADGLTGVIEIYGRTAEQLENAVVDLELMPFGSQAPSLRGRADLLAPRAADRGLSREARVELPLQGVVPGEYVVRVTIRTGRETAAEVLRDLTILPGSSATAAPPAPVPRAARPDATGVLKGEIVLRWLARIPDGTLDRRLQDAATLISKGDWAGTEQALQEADPAAADVSALRGLARLGGGDAAGAIAALKSYCDARPDDAVGTFVLGWAYMAAGDDRAAVSAWRAAMLADPRLVPAYLAAVNAYLRLGQPALALQVVRAGLAALPDSPELRDVLVRLEGR